MELVDPDIRVKETQVAAHKAFTFLFSATRQQAKEIIERLKEQKDSRCY